jgi:hypothetical protein
MVPQQRFLPVIPGIFFQLFVPNCNLRLSLSIPTITIDVLTHLGVFRRMAETFQPAQVADMNHTTDSWFQFNEHAIRSDVLHQSFVTASQRELRFDGAPGIRRELLNRQTHLAIVLAKGYNFRFVLVAEFEEFFCVDGRIAPGNFAT